MDKILEQVYNLPAITLTENELFYINRFLRDNDHPQRKSFQAQLNHTNLSPCRKAALSQFVFAWLDVSAKMVNWQIKVADAWVKITHQDFNDDKLAELIYHLLPNRPSYLLQIQKNLFTMQTLDDEIFALLANAISAKRGNVAMQSYQETATVVKAITEQDFIDAMTKASKGLSEQIALNYKTHLSAVDKNAYTYYQRLSAQDLIEEVIYDTQEDMSVAITTNAKLNFYLNKYQIVKSIYDCCKDANIDLEQKIATIKGFQALHNDAFKPISTSINDWVQYYTHGYVRLNTLQNSIWKHDFDIPFYNLLKQSADEFKDIKAIAPQTNQSKNFEEPKQEPSKSVLTF